MTISSPVGTGTFLIQDCAATGLEHSFFQVWVRRSSSTPFGAFDAGLRLDWDRGGGYSVGTISANVWSPSGYPAGWKQV